MTQGGPPGGRGRGRGGDVGMIGRIAITAHFMEQMDHNVLSQIQTDRPDYSRRGPARIGREPEDLLVCAKAEACYINSHANHCPTCVISLWVGSVGRGVGYGGSE